MNKANPVPTCPIPRYPQDIPALLSLLIAREAARLNGPTVAQYMADDKTGEAHLLYATAHATLRAAQSIVENLLPRDLDVIEAVKWVKYVELQEEPTNA